MQRIHARSVLLALVAGAAFITPACASDNSASGDAATNDTATNDTAAAETPSADAPAADDSAPAEVPSRDGAMTFEEFLFGSDSNSVSDSMELTKLVTVMGNDKDGYIAGDTVVVPAAAGDERFMCTARDQLKLETYTLIIVDESGAAVECD